MRFIEPETPQGFELIPSLAVMGSTPVWVQDERYNPIRIDGNSVSVEKMVKELAEESGRPVGSLYQTLYRVRTFLLECIQRRLAVET